MRLIIASKKTLITVFVLILVIIFAISFFIIYNKTEETFNSDVYYQGNVDDKIVSIACNIDWGSEFIPDMLNVLKENKVKITFFPTGKWAEKNEDLLKEIYSSGHEIGNHGYNHIDYDRLSYEKNKEEIEKAHNIIKKILNIDSSYFAPPSGAYSDDTIRAAKDLGYELTMWSIDTIDWRNDRTKDIIFKRATDKLHNSAIILIHPTKETVEALKEIIPYIKDNGYKIGKISDIIKNK